MNAVVNARQWQLPSWLEALRPYRQWSVWRLVENASGGKPGKLPIDYCTGNVPAKGHGGLAIWTDFDTAASAAARFGSAHGVAFNFTANDPFAFIDIDNALQPDNTWSPLVHEIYTMFPNAAWELSISGRGLHGFITYVGPAPPHSCKNVALGIELYTEGRWAALTFRELAGHVGNVAIDYTQRLAALVAKYFQPTPRAEVTLNTWTNEPAWHVPGSEDDAVLIERARRSKSGRAVFGGKASFEDLWTANTDALARTYPDSGSGAYDDSSADQALANHLLWWTGGDCERAWRLMWSSALMREKWEREDYLRRTIRRALACVANSPPKAAADVVPSAQGVFPDTVTLHDFYAYLPLHQYIFAPTRELWPAASVNSRLPPVDGVKASVWLDNNRSVEQMTWMPGHPLVIPDRVVSDGGWIDKPGCSVFNLYREPPAITGDSSQAGPWLDHVRRVYPDSADYLVKWLAHRVQRPGEKINHALVLGGSQGIGKNTILEPVKHAIGAWNFVEVLPPALLGRFNGFVKSVILRVSEARDLGEVDRYGFYERMKTYTAAPPDVHRCDEKNLREHAVANVCGVIITTNHKTDGIYLPPDDRRHYVTWSDASKEDFPDGYWRDLYGWYAAGGLGHVAAYLTDQDLSAFDPKAPPPKTAAFYDILDANRAPQDAELADALEALGTPPAVTLSQLASNASPALQAWLSEPRSRRQIPHRFEAAGYIPVRNDAAADRLWKIWGKRQVIYGRKDLSARDRIAAAVALCMTAPPPPQYGVR